MKVNRNRSRAEVLENEVFQKQILGTTFTMINTTDGIIKQRTFRNFDRLKFETGNRIEDCVFEDCDKIYFDGCRVENCVFKRVGMIYVIGSNISDSRFTGLRCSDNVLLIDLVDSEIRHCSFDGVCFEETPYLCSSAGDSWIESVIFFDDDGSHEEQKIVLFEQIVGSIFKHKTID